MGIKSGIERFFSKTLWEMEPSCYSGAKRLGVNALQISSLVIRDFWMDNCLLRASALAFSTILSIVPFFALMFALLKGLGVQNTLEPFLLEQVAAGSEETVQRIVTYINNTKVASLGAVGLVTLIITVITLLGNIEEAFNVIWGVKETRSFYRKFSDYLSVVVSGPLLLFAAVSVTTSLQSQALVKNFLNTAYLGDFLLFAFQTVPYICMWAALIFLYTFIPNTKVRFPSALLGGVLAGTLWELAQWGYIHFQVGVAKYNAIYGTLSILPIFMVWIYTSWLIVLLGVEVVYAHQNRETFRREAHSLTLSFAAKERLALAIMLEVSRAFHLDRPAWTPERMGSELGVPVRVVNDLLSLLSEEGFLVETSSDPPCIQPARALEHIPVKGLLDLVRRKGEACLSEMSFEGGDVLEELFARVDQLEESALGGMTMKELVERAT